MTRKDDWPKSAALSSAGTASGERKSFLICVIALAILLAWLLGDSRLRSITPLRAINKRLADSLLFDVHAITGVLSFSMPRISRTQGMTSVNFCDVKVRVFDGVQTAVQDILVTVSNDPGDDDSFAPGILGGDTASF